MNIAPIVLFVYNRPEHTRKTLEALRLNDLASESILYIYADGAKQNASKTQLEAVAATRKVIKEQLWCGDVVLIESQENKGLANSVISGVTDVIEKHKKVIVLEDDIIVNSGFLRYMNTSLHLYEKEGSVFGVSGYKFESNRIIKDKTYFLPVMSSWGYGTWKDRWEKIDFDSKSLLQKVLDRDLMGKMKFGKFNFYDMLQQQANGIIDSWAVRFYTSMIIQNGLFLFPKESLLTNIGFDGSGVHCDNASSPLFETITALNIEKIEVKVEKRILNLFKVSKNKKQSILKGFREKIKRVIAPELLNYIRRKRGAKKIDPFEDLRNMPRFVETKCKLDNVPIVIPDAASFLFMHKEIFEQEIYKFIAPTDEPFIIDAGANIGLSTIYFKKLYPKASVLAFEPDDYIFKYLKKNILQFGLKEVLLIKKGLWDKEIMLGFNSEGADGGAIDFNEQKKTQNEIEVTSLKPFLNRKVDFLKIDIEGAEYTVLQDIKDRLNLVDNIFVEYHSFVNQEQKLGEIVSILQKSGFRLHVNSPGLSSVQPFKKINTYNGMDMQLNIYGYR
ncbi:MAG: FkbM family methyltransferase [Nonlabens sp.]|jgi:FkbM family methyltransferase|uniref:FkbM family methyltransferase n=1 Tax=Nonlabens sp. TaxID=1888209 RepID=UPI0039E60ABE